MPQSFLPGETAGVPNALWPRLWSILMRRGIEPQASPLPNRPQFEQEGQPLFSSEATADALPQLRDLFEMPQVTPSRSAIGGQPSLPQTPGLMEWINRVGRAYQPEPVDQVRFGPGTSVGQRNPRLGRLADMLGRQAAFLDPQGVVGQEYAYQRGLEEQRRAMPLAQFMTGSKMVGTLDEMRRAQMKEDQDVQMFPLDLEAKRQAIDTNAALAEQRRRADEDAITINTFRKEWLDLATVPEAQRTPEQQARFAALDKVVNSGGSQGTPFSIVEYNLARDQGYKGTFEDWKKEVANVYMEGRYIPTLNQQTGQVGATFPNQPGMPTTYAAPGVTTPTNFGKIADATRAFETTDAMLDDIERLAGDVITSEGAWDGFQQTLRGVAASTPTAAIRSQFPKEAQFVDTVQAFSSMMSRAAGETGNLSGSDVARIINALPSLTRDSKEIATGKMATVRQLYKNVVQGALAAYSSGSIPTAEDFAGAGVREGGILRDPDTGRRWVLQGGTPRPIILGD